MEDGPAHLGACSECLAVFRSAAPRRLAAIDALYRSDEYVRSVNLQHLVSVEEYAEPVPYQVLQANRLAPLLPTKPEILDIGCLDGALLREFARHLDGALLCGYDVSDLVRPLFPEGENFHLFTENLERIPGSFDLVVLSHSVQYIRDASGLMAQLRRLLKPGGMVFLQTPNFATKPASLLMGDQHYFYTPAVLASTLHHNGFAFEEVESPWFPRDVLGLARIPPQLPPVWSRREPTIVECLDYLESMARSLRDLTGNDLAVLGTTIEAAFAASILEERIARFVDENPAKVGTPFHGRSVVHPTDLADGDVVVIPYGTTANAIATKFRSRYRGCFVPV